MPVSADRSGHAERAVAGSNRADASGYETVDPGEVSPTAHYGMGGVVADDRDESGLAAGLSHGPCAYA